jgi:pimeloyl-ACP methyl ester carboxylesterase
MPVDRRFVLAGLVSTFAHQALAADTKPVVFWFYGSVAESLQDCPLSVEEFRVFSVDLLCHGSDVRNGEPAKLDGWRYRVDHGEGLLDRFCSECSAKLDDIGATSAIVGGVSRGGFAAMHLSIRDPRFRFVVALSPVTDLSKLTEFAGYASDPLPLNIEVLSSRSIFLSIESRDQRVSTTSTVDLVDRIANGQRDASLALVVEPGGEHTVTTYARRAAIDWARRIIQ